MVAHCRALDPLAGARLQPVLLHQPNDPLATDALRPLDEILVNPRTAVPLPAFFERGPHENLEPSISQRVRGLGSATRGVEAARRHVQVLTELGDRELGA